MEISCLEGKKVFITGATGLIGQALVKTLISHKGEKPISVVALVRDRKKAENIFGCGLQNVTIIEKDVCDLTPQPMDIDYIIHGASITSSKAFVNQPVDVINANIIGTKNVLEFARVNPVKSVVYLSTMEVYGSPQTDEKIFEDHSSNLNTMKARSCYPESKRMCECLGVSYLSQYNVPFKVIRLTQTFGSGVDYNDGRVFAEFARCAIEGRDIILKTKGQTSRNYLYTQDAVNAILTVLIKGKDGEVYNAANEDTYCTIYEMAQFVASNFGGGKINVKVIETDIQLSGYAPTLKMNLSTEKLRDLGWEAQTDMFTAYSKMIEWMKSDKQK